MCFFVMKWMSGEELKVRKHKVRSRGRLLGRSPPPRPKGRDGLGPRTLIGGAQPSIGWWAPVVQCYKERGGARARHTRFTAPPATTPHPYRSRGTGATGSCTSAARDLWVDPEDEVPSPRPQPESHRAPSAASTRGRPCDRHRRHGRCQPRRHL